MSRGGLVLLAALAFARANRKQVRYHGALLSEDELARLRALGYAVPERDEH